MSWRCGCDYLRIMRWELARTGGFADIAFMWVDVVQRELATNLFHRVRSCVAGLHQDMEIVLARTCNADHGEKLWKVEHVGMALTAGAAWAINCKAKSVGTWKVSPQQYLRIYCSMHKRHRRALQIYSPTCIVQGRWCRFFRPAMRWRQSDHHVTQWHKHAHSNNKNIFFCYWFMIPFFFFGLYEKHLLAFQTWCLLGNSDTVFLFLFYFCSHTESGLSLMLKVSCYTLSFFTWRLLKELTKTKVLVKKI